MIKPPIVQAIGTMRTLGLWITDDSLYNALRDMGQLPYFPPTVAGWEGGVAWLNTNTALSRFALANRLLTLSYAKLPTKAPEDVPTETPKQAFDRAHAAVGRPWLAAKGTTSSLMYYATTTRAASRQRPHRAPARPARVHARRPRRPGDVMDDRIRDAGPPEPLDAGAVEAIRCADCARSDSLVTGLDPVDVMPISAEAMAGLPRRRAPRQGHGPAQLPARRRPGHGLGLRRQPHRLDAGLRGRRGRGREPGQPAGDDLPQRRQRRAQHRRARRRVRDLRGQAPPARPRPGPLGATARWGARSCRGPATATPGPTSASRGWATTATPAASTPSGATARGAPDRTSPCGPPPTTRRPTAPTSTRATTGSRAPCRR